MTNVEELVLCPVCEGPGMLLGNLGEWTHFRCRDCGMMFHEKPRDNKAPRDSVDTELSEGDEVVFSRDFLRNTGQITGDAANDVGTILYFIEVGRRHIAEVDFDIAGEQKVDPSNLTRKDRIHLERM